MNWIVLGASLAAVFVVAAIALALGLGRGAQLGERERVFAMARDFHSGFRPVDAAIDGNGRAALVRGDDGDFVLLKLHGVHGAGRYFAATPSLESKGGTLLVQTGERMFGTVAIDVGADEARRWAGKREAAHA